MDKNVLIIGASGDIGLAISKQLASEGYQLILHYHQNQKVIEKFLLASSQECVLQVIQADLLCNDDLETMINEIAYPIHRIVFASGLGHYGLFQHVSDQAVDHLLTLHIKAPLKITKHFLTKMIQNEYGKIIFITSIWGTVGASSEVVYSTVKGAQNSFVKALAKEVGPSGINVNAVSPGYIQTKMNDHLSGDEQKEIISEIPLERPGLPEDIAYTTSFLLNEKSNYIQGEVIQVTGGWQ